MLACKVHASCTAMQPVTDTTQEPMRPGADMRLIGQIIQQAREMAPDLAVSAVPWSYHAPAA